MPEHDDYLQPDAARQAFAVVPQAEVIAVEGAKHLWVGMADRVLDEIVRVVNPAGVMASAGLHEDGRLRHENDCKRMVAKYGAVPW